MLKLTKKRELLGWSKAKLSRESGVNTSTISMVENGRLIPYATQLRKMADALNWDEDPATLMEEFVAADRNANG